MINLLIVDDHAIIRSGLKQLFSLVDDIKVVAEAENGVRALEQLRAYKVDVALIDMTMPGISGVDLIGRIYAKFEHLPILVLSMHDEAQIAQQAIAAGAAGYLTKDSDPETLLTAIRKVATGGRAMDASLAEAMAFAGARGTTGLAHERLSAREYHIMRLLAKGLRISEIANSLSISHKTVSTHKARIMEKMGFQNIAELVRYVLSHNLEP